MKKGIFILFIVSVLIASFLFVSCSKDVEEKEYTIVAPDGATALALTSFIKDAKINDEAKMKAQIVTATQIAQEATKSDFAIVPANLAAKMYSNGAKIKVISTITNGNLYLMSSVQKENFTFEDLKGKILYSIGQAAIPSMILLSLLNANNIPYDLESEDAIAGSVVIKYCQDGATLLPNLVQAKQKGVEAYGLLADPAVTNAKNGGKAFEVLDIQQAYKDQTGSEVYGFAQAVLIAKEDIANNEKLVSAVVEKLQKNDTYVSENAQDAYGVISGAFATTLPKTLTNEIVARCNLKTLRAKDNKEYIKQTLDSIYSINKMAVGNVPALDSGFYA